MGVLAHIRNNTQFRTAFFAWGIVPCNIFEKVFPVVLQGKKFAVMCKHFFLKKNTVIDPSVSETGLDGRSTEGQWKALRPGSEGQRKVNGRSMESQWKVNGRSTEGQRKVNGIYIYILYIHNDVIHIIYTYIYIYTLYIIYIYTYIIPCEYCKWSGPKKQKFNLDFLTWRSGYI